MEATSHLVGPPAWSRLPWGFEAWVVTRYADVRMVLSDARLIRDVGRVSEIRGGVGLSPLHGGGVGRGVTILHTDPPGHTRLRRVVSPWFTARRIEGLRPMVSRLAADLVDRFVSRGQADLVAEFALPLSVGVLCELAGLPPDDFRRFGPWVHQVHQMEGGAEAGRRTGEAIRAMDEYLGDVLSGRSTPGGPVGVLADLASSVTGNGGLTDDELVAFGRDLLVGGYESTTNAMAGGFLALLTRPARLAELVADPELVPLAVEELLRHVTPFPLLEARCAVEDLEIGGVAIARGEPVVTDLHAANRDPARFPDPEALTVEAAARGQLSFGPGTHHCLGAALARLELAIALRTVLSHLPELQLGCRPEAIEWLSGFSPGPRSVPVIFDPV